jgi:uncharacterized membrane protein YgdD (TMEM256/DUF423 family)
MPRLTRLLVVTGSLSLLLAAWLSALGFHALDDVLGPEKQRSWEWANRMQFYHSLALVLLGLLATRMQHTRLLGWAGGIMVFGLVCFSGSIYAELLGAPEFVGQVAPIGGTSFMLGWLLVAIAVYRDRAAS